MYGVWQCKAYEVRKERRKVGIL